MGALERVPGLLLLQNTRYCIAPAWLLTCAVCRYLVMLLYRRFLCTGVYAALTGFLSVIRIVLTAVNACGCMALSHSVLPPQALSASSAAMSFMSATGTVAGLGTMCCASAVQPCLCCTNQRQVRFMRLGSSCELWGSLAMLCLSSFCVQRSIAMRSPLRSGVMPTTCLAECITRFLVPPRDSEMIVISRCLP